MTQRLNRLEYFDNIRALMIIFVILMHAAVTYSGLGGWYYKENESIDFISTLSFALFQTHLQAFFMALLFLIAGYFTAFSIDKKSTSKFVKSRLFRLGLPTLFYILFIHPLCVKLAIPSLHFGEYFANGLQTLKIFSWSGPLWFAAALLFFSLLYAGMRPIFSRIGLVRITYSFKNILAIIGIITILAFLFRLVFPVGSSIVNFQIGYFAAYIVFFILGILSYRNSSFDNIDHKIGQKYIRMAWFIGLPFWIVLMILGGPADGEFLINGGWNWQAFAFAVWESFFCVTFSIGLVGTFKEKFNSQNSVQKFLSDHAFGVYVFHAPILIGISIILKNVMLHPMSKFCLVSAIVIPCSFVFSWMIKKIPVFKRMFS